MIFPFSPPILMPTIEYTYQKNHELQDRTFVLYWHVLTTEDMFGEVSTPDQGWGGPKAQGPRPKALSTIQSSH